MSRSRARAALAAAVLLAASCAPFAGAQEREAAAPRRAESRSAIHGRVVSEATGRPLRRTQVMLTMVNGSRVDRLGLTDGRGEFRLGKLPAGRYVVWAGASGMLTPAAVQHAGGESSADPEALARHFEVVEVDGRNEREVTVRARRGGVITGRIAYADGDPAPGVFVHLLRREGGRLALVPARAYGLTAEAPRTDDRGVYRAVGLPPGEYVVAVFEAADHAGVAAARGSILDMGGMSDLPFHQQLLITYHPAATSAEAAEVITVRGGEEHADVNVTIPERELHKVAGVVRAARGGLPLKGARVSLTPKQDSPGGELAPSDSLGGVVTDAEGRWHLHEIPEGLYTLSVQQSDEPEPEAAAAPNANGEAETNASPRLPARKRRRFAPLRRELRVSADVDELVVELGEGGRVSGTVVVEGGKKQPAIYVTATRAAKTFVEGAAEPAQNVPAAAGHFELEGLAPGKYFLSARDYSEEGGFYLKSITWQGRDLLREPLEVAEGAQVEGVRVVYSGDPAVLNARLARAGRPPTSSVDVFLLPADLSRWSLHGQQLFCSIGPEGSCRISAPPGEYAVVTATLSDFLKDPEQALRRRFADAPRVSLSAGEVKTFDVTVKEK